MRWQSMSSGKSFRIDSSKPLIRPESILHTDSAKAYRRVGPLRWNPESVLLTEFQDQPDFLKFKWVHTTVTHKKKPGVPIRYVETAEIIMHDGTVKQVEKGSEKIDGYWATMRRCVGKTSVTTGHSSNKVRRLWLHKLVRAHQWHYWHLGVERFSLLGGIFRARRNAQLSF